MKNRSTLRLVILSIVTLCIGFLGGFFYPRTLEPGQQTPSTIILKDDSTYDGQIVQVGSVLDGDTIELTNGEKIRYEGIDAPELRDTWGMEAFEYNQTLVNGKSIRLELDRNTRDVYNRLLAYVWVNGEMVNEKLLKEGYAKTYTAKGEKVIRYRDRFREAENEARQDHRGLWVTEWLNQTEK